MRKDLIYPIAVVIATAGLAGCGHGKVADKQDEAMEVSVA